MRIVVLVKQVFDPDAKVRLDAAGSVIEPDDPNAYVLNGYDAHAVEEALRLRESGVDAELAALSVGPPRVQNAVRRAMGMGVEQGVHLLGDVDDPFAVAQAVAAWLREHPCDLVLTGVMSSDRMQGLIGPLTAAALDWPCVTQAAELAIDRESGSAIVQQELEGGLRQEVEVELPAVVTVQSGPHRPRYPSLSNMLRARESELVQVELDTAALPQPHWQTVRIEQPQRTRAGLMLDGSPQRKAERLLSLLRERNVLAEAR